jgi:hypothetical protein
VTRLHRLVLAAALATAGTGAVAATTLAPAATPAPAPEAAAPGLCIDLSALNLPSICLGSLIPPGVL